MAEDKITLAIFDFDGTLTEGHLWLGISKHHREHKIKRLSLFTYLFSHLPFWFAAKMKLYSEEKNRAKWGEDLSTLFKGFTPAQARQAFEWVADNYFMPLMRPDILEVLNSQKKQGNRIVLLSGMFDTFLEMMGKRIGTDYVVGTKMELLNSVYSGRIIKPLCFGENKVKLLKQFIQEQNLSVDYSQSTAYADSIYDLPVLKIVGHPVATYPDKELYELALREKWEVIRSRGDTLHASS